MQEVSACLKMVVVVVVVVVVVPMNITQLIQTAGEEELPEKICAITNTKCYTSFIATHSTTSANSSCSSRRSATFRSSSSEILAPRSASCSCNSKN